MMLEQMSAAEYADWQAYYSMEPFSEVRADMRAANQMIVSLKAAGVKDRLKLTDFMPDFWGDYAKAKATPEQIQQDFGIVKAIQQARRMAKKKEK